MGAGADGLTVETGGGQEAAQQVPLVVGKVGIETSDFYRLNCATSKENPKNRNSNQVFLCVFLIAIFPKKTSFFLDEL